MLYKMTKAIYEELKKDDNLKVFTEELEKSSHVWLQFGIKNGPSYRIRFISRDDDNDVAVRVFALLHVEENMQSKVLPVINDLNCRFRYVKFSMDKDGDVNLDYDYLVRDPNPAVSAREILIRITDIVDKAYPEFMRAMWS